MKKTQSVEPAVLPLSAKPRLHGSEYLYQFFLCNNIGDHGVQVIQERTAEDPAFISELLITLQNSRIINLHADTAAHNTDFFDPRIREAVKFPAGDGFDFPDSAYVIALFKQFDGL